MSTGNTDNSANKFRAVITITHQPPSIYPIHLLYCLSYSAVTGNLECLTGHKAEDILERVPTHCRAPSHTRTHKSTHMCTGQRCQSPINACLWTGKYTGVTGGNPPNHRRTFKSMHTRQNPHMKGSGLETLW